jgi:hypothetical protein
MALKRVWVQAPKKFKSKTGNDIYVGATTLYNTGKVYKGTGAKEAARAAKRKAKDGA